ncbi:MAG: HAMP domain-containing histidine kinase, partial [Acidobacteria bacterium]|nr:HAMP domain-containing histidine kinase [Acidobacteriota bacterium]
MKLAVKLALGLMLASALVFVLYAWQVLNAQRRHAEQLVTASAERMSDIIRRSTRYQMLRNDREALYQMIRDMGAEPGIRRIRIFSKTGEIRFSTGDSEVNRVVDKSAEACYGCHAQAAPLEKLNRADRARIFTNENGERVLGVILPIENQKDCSSADCHVHPPSQKVLGVIDAQLSLAAVDQQTAEHSRMLARYTTLAIALVSLLSAVFIWAQVYLPLRPLVGGIRRVAAGDLEGSIPVESHDEIGQVAAEFNHMTGELKAARNEITGFTRTLELRVERKTRELEQAHHSLLHSEKLASVGKLAATVAHEINNPLFGILTNARLAKKQMERSGLEPAQQTKLGAKLEIIEHESRRCGEIVRNLLMFSRQSPPHMEEVMIETIVERCVSLVGHSYQLQSIQLSVDLEDRTTSVKGDPGQLQQVLLALLVNAADAMPQGGQVSITSRVDGKEAILRVRDNGPGIPADIQERIFEPFFSTKEDGHSTGLGLAIASGIVEQHRGQIAVESSPGKGAEFTIR